MTDAINGPDDWRRFRARGLAVDALTLPMILTRHGYETGAVVAGPWLKKVFGLNKGFTFFDDRDIETLNGRDARSVTASALDWIEQPREGPFFLFLNYFDPHTPLDPPPKYARMFLPGDVAPEALSRGHPNRGDLYDAEIRYMDFHIGVLFDQLRKMDLYDPTWIIVTADHGDLFDEHEKSGHGESLYQEEIHVPLLMKYPQGDAPGAPASKNDSLIQLTDIMPLICEHLSMEIPPGVQGGTPPDVGHPIFAEVVYPLSHQNVGSTRTLIEGNYKNLWDSQTGVRLFDIEKDPGELNNLTFREPERRQQMSKKMNMFHTALSLPGPAPPPAVLDEETTEALRNLGYLE